MLPFLQLPRAISPAVAAFTLALAFVLSPSSAFGRGNGITASGCVGCHRDEGAEVTLTPDGPLVPGEEAIFTIRLTGGPLKTGGVFVPHPQEGTLRALDGEGLALVSLGLSHTTPRSAANGAVTFRFAWRPPKDPGGTTFEVYALSTNGNGNASGDVAAGTIVDFVYGCEPQTYYRDADEDGFGWDSDTLVRCADRPPKGYAALPGDCDDFRAETHPGAVEVCNNRDDDCDGEIDEDAIPVELWPDGDGDGYYARREGEPLLGCVPTKGYAAEPGDCDDENPDVHPGAEEVCNYIDDNCDGRVDERVRPRCGVGFCVRESYSCLPEDCYPGEPSEETCSGLDENCNGLVDEGILCERGFTCISGECLPDADTGLAGDLPGSGDTAGAGGCAFRPGGSATTALVLFGLALFRARRDRRSRGSGSG